MKSSRFPDRIRFNWGFHDAQSDMEHTGKNRAMPGIQRFPLPDDSAYCAGYHAGVADYSARNGRSESSEDAWQAHVAKRAA